MFGKFSLGIRVRVAYVGTVSQDLKDSAHGWEACACDCICVWVEFRDEILLRGEECETPENPRFWIKDNIVISDENPEIF